MAPRLEIFYASDIHGSERVFRKFLNAAAFYKARAIVFGGDLTGKAIVPFVETSPGSYQAEVFGTEHFVMEGSALDELEQFVRDRGAYPYRTTAEEMTSLAADPGLLKQTFSRRPRRPPEPPARAGCRTTAIPARAGQRGHGFMLAALKPQMHSGATRKPGMAITTARLRVPHDLRPPHGNRAVR